MPIEISEFETIEDDLNWMPAIGGGRTLRLRPLIESDGFDESETSIKVSHLDSDSMLLVVVDYANKEVRRRHLFAVKQQFLRTLQLEAFKNNPHRAINDLSWVSNADISKITVEHIDYRRETGARCIGWVKN